MEVRQAAIDRNLEDARRTGHSSLRDRMSLALLQERPELSNYLAERVLETDPNLMRVMLLLMASDLSAEDAAATTSKFASIATGELIRTNSDCARRLPSDVLLPTTPFGASQAKRFVRCLSPAIRPN